MRHEGGGGAEAGAHTIVLLQPVTKASSRTFLDYEDLSAALDGVCELFEGRLKDLHPNSRNISYDVQDLFTFIDGLTDISMLVLDAGAGVYRPFDRQWIKDRCYHHLKRQAR